MSALGPRHPRLRAAGISQHTLGPALAAHVVELADGNTRFTHPLLASVLERRQPATQARRVHRMLAGVAEDPLGSTGPYQRSGPIRSLSARHGWR